MNGGDDDYCLADERLMKTMTMGRLYKSYCVVDENISFYGENIGFYDERGGKLVTMIVVR